MGVYGIWPVIKARPRKIQDPNVEGLENKSRGSRNNKVWRPDSIFHPIYGIFGSHDYLTNKTALQNEVLRQSTQSIHVWL